MDGCRCAWGGSEVEGRKIKLAGAYCEIILGSGGLAPGVLILDISWGGWSGSRFSRFTAGSFSFSLNRRLVGHQTGARSSGIFYVLCAQSRVK